MSLLLTPEQLAEIKRDAGKYKYDPHWVGPTLDELLDHIAAREQQVKEAMQSLLHDVGYTPGNYEGGRAILNFQISHNKVVRAQAARLGITLD